MTINLRPITAPHGEDYNAPDHAQRWIATHLNFQAVRQGLQQTPSRGKLVTTTYDLTTASGNQSITGFGFDPQSGLIIAGVDADSSRSWGLFDADGQVQLSDNSIATGSGVRLVVSGGDQEGVVSLITDGIQIAWTKTGTPTETAVIAVLAWP